MQLEIAKGIVDAATIDGTGLQLRDDYSGRSMYGAKTAAIVADSLTDFLVGLARFCGDLDPMEQDREIEEAVLACQDLRTDSMGMGIVLY